MYPYFSRFTNCSMSLLSQWKTIYRCKSTFLTIESIRWYVNISFREYSSYYGLYILPLVLTFLFLIFLSFPDAVCESYSGSKYIYKNRYFHTIFIANSNIDLTPESDFIVFSKFRLKTLQHPLKQVNWMVVCLSFVCCVSCMHRFLSLYILKTLKYFKLSRDLKIYQWY